MSDADSMSDANSWSDSGSDNETGDERNDDFTPQQELGFKEREGRSFGVELTDNEAILADKLTAILIGGDLERYLDGMRNKVKSLKKPQYVNAFGFILGFLMISDYSFKRVKAIRTAIAEESTGENISDADIIRYYRLLSS
jgi:hypothetical protein